jgi:hypothetical protein
VDAAIAGLVGALGGGLLGATGAWGAALIAFRGARYQADQQRESARDQWLRQIRRDAYTQFITAAQQIHQTLAHLHDADTPARHEELRRQVNQQIHALHHAKTVMQLEAPSHIATHADQITNVAITTSHGFRQEPPDVLQSLARLVELGDLIQSHLALCQSSLAK